MPETRYLNNPDLKTILPGWEGNTIVNGEFVDLKEGAKVDFSKFLKWRFTRNDKREEKKNDKWRLIVNKGGDFLKQENDCIVWLGHASFYMQLRGQEY